MARPGVAARELHVRAQLAARRVDRGPDADEHRHRQQRERGAGEDRHAQADVLDARQVGRQERHEGVDRPRRGDEAERAADGEERRDLGRRLRDQPSARGAERRAHRQLALTRQRAGEQQVRQVRAADQQHRRDGGEQHIQRPPDGGHGVGQHRHDLGIGPLVHARILARELRRDRRHVRLRPRDRHARFQSRDREIRVRQSVDQLPAIEGERHVDLIVARRERELGPHHADDGVRLAAERDRAADNRRIGGEAADPEAVGQERDTIAADRLLLRGERAADERRHAEHGEQVRRDARAVQPLGIAPAGEVEVGDGAHRGNAVEHLIARPPVVDAGHRARRAHDFALVRSAIDVDQPIRLAIWQRLQQDAVDDAEHRRRGADAERDGERRGNGEARRANE